jgi:Na+/H+ antiporter NhaD/arsenite permease-like protein
MTKPALNSLPAPAPKSALWLIIKQEAVLVTAFLCAMLTMFIVPPSSAYLDYIDFRVLALLFCLMVVVAGVQSCGLFDVLAQRLLSGSKSIRYLCLLLILMPFLGSMLITNDVALLAFVPFAIVVLDMIGRPQYLIMVITAQTLAANLGSMATPIGNPQNLFLYSKFHIPISSFLAAMLPYTLLSLVGLALMVLVFKKESIEVRFDTVKTISNPRQLVLMAVLFLLCLLSVLHLIHYGVVLAVVLASMVLFAKQLFRKADYSLLATFVFFFICAGNIGQMDILRNFLTSMMGKSSLISSVLASQVISNVPAAVLLSGFTEQWKELLVGVNVGGLGTLIASLASLISFKLYLKTPGARPLKYLGVFTVANAAGLLVLLAAAIMLE